MNCSTECNEDLFIPHNKAPLNLAYKCTSIVAVNIRRLKTSHFISFLLPVTNII